ncbi:hypothetical protein [Streptomyces sp. DB-54]
MADLLTLTNPKYALRLLGDSDGVGEGPIALYAQADYQIPGVELKEVGQLSDGNFLAWHGVSSCGFIKAPRNLPFLDGS